MPMRSMGAAVLLVGVLAAIPAACSSAQERRPAAADYAAGRVPAGGGTLAQAPAPRGAAGFGTRGAEGPWYAGEPLKVAWITNTFEAEAVAITATLLEAPAQPGGDGTETARAGRKAASDTGALTFRAPRVRPVEVVDGVVTALPFPGAAQFSSLVTLPRPGRWQLALAAGADSGAITVEVSTRA